MLISFHFIPFSVYSLKEVICTVKANLQVPPIQPFEGTPRMNVGDTCTLLPATGHLDEVMAELRTQCGIPGTIYLHIQYVSIYIYNIYWCDTVQGPILWDFGKQTKNIDESCKKMQKGDNLLPQDSGKAFKRIHRLRRVGKGSRKCSRMVHSNWCVSLQWYIYTYMHIIYNCVYMYVYMYVM